MLYTIAWKDRLGDLSLHTERRLNIGAHNAIAGITRLILLAKPGNPRLCEPDANVDLAGPNCRDHMARPRREWDELRVEAEVLVRKMEGGGEVLRHEADADLRVVHFIVC